MGSEQDPVEIFTTVAPKYELLNALFTAGQDRKWRLALLRASESALGRDPDDVLDLACGTGDIPRLMVYLWPSAQITGTDPNAAMLEVAKRKVAQQRNKQPSLAKILWKQERAEALSLADSSTDLVTISFGLRNVPAESRAMAMAEAFRVLRPGGVYAVLELGLPRPGLIRSVYKFMLSNAMPPMAGLFSPRDAYDYLARSIQEFPEPEALRLMMRNTGFLAYAPKQLSGGLCWLYVGRKPKDS